MRRGLLGRCFLAASVVGAAMGQSFIIPSVTDTHECEWNELVGKIAAVDSICCPGGDCAGVRCTGTSPMLPV